MRANDTRRSQTAATTLQMSVAALVRARTVGFRPRRRGLHDPHRRAVDWAPYLNSALLRLCVKNADAWGHPSLPTQQNFLTGTRPTRRPVGVAVHLLLCCQVRGHLGRSAFCDRDGGAPLGGLERGHPGRSALKLGGAWDGLFSTGTVLEP